MTGPDEPLSCETVLDLLEPFVDGDLDAAEEARLRAHLAGCASCAAERDLAEQIRRELRALPQPECPPELLARVVQAGRGEVVPFPSPLKTPRRTQRLRIAAAAAVVALAVGGGSLFVHLQHVQQQREQVAQATREARLALAYFGKVTRADEPRHPRRGPPETAGHPRHPRCVAIAEPRHGRGRRAAEGALKMRNPMIVLTLLLALTAAAGHAQTLRASPATCRSRSSASSRPTR